jgi:hypothetical protein
MGLQFTPFACWKVSTSADFFRFPWLRYGVDAPSSGKEYMMQVDYTQIENTSVYLRYKYKQKDKNQTLPEGKPAVLPYEHHRARLQVQYRIQSVLFKTSVDGSLYNEKDDSRSKGLMAAQCIGWQPGRLPFQTDLYAAYFRTDDYNTRLSTYEKNILYAFHTLQMYGKGIRFSARLRWDTSDSFSLFAKLASTHYTGRNATGTGLEEIEGNTKTDLSLLLRWKF